MIIMSQSPKSGQLHSNVFDDGLEIEKTITVSIP